MGDYVYTLRKPTKRIETVEGPIYVPSFEYSYKPSWSMRHDARYERSVGSKLAAADRARDHHLDLNGGSFLALDGEWLVRTRRSNYNDGYDMAEIHEEIIGRVKKFERQLTLIRTSDLTGAQA